MGVNLVKGQKISLAKELGEELAKVMIGLGWDPVAGSAASIDLDASCVLYDAQNKNVDCVYFGNLSNMDKSIVHQGDNLTGEGDGDDEQIMINLQRVPPGIASIIVTITSYGGQTFDTIQNAFCRLVDLSNNREVARFSLTGTGKFTAQIMVRIYRHNGQWKFHAIGQPCYGKTFRDVLPAIEPFL